MNPEVMQTLMHKNSPKMDMDSVYCSAYSPLGVCTRQCALIHFGPSRTLADDKIYVM